MASIFQKKKFSPKFTFVLQANVATTINPSEQQLLTSARNTLNRARLLEKELTNIKSKIASLESNGDS